MTPGTIQIGDGIATGEIGPVCVIIWRKAVTWPRFRIQERAIADLVAQRRASAGIVCIVEPTSAPPNEELRRASSHVLATHGKAISCVAFVIEGAGFRAAIVRSVLSGIALLASGKSAPVSYFATAAAGLVWMRKYMDVGPSTEFVLQVEELRSRLGPFREAAPEGNANANGP